MEKLKELKKEHNLLTQEFSKRKKKLDACLSMSLQSVVCCSHNIVKAYERLRYFREQVSLAFKELDEVLIRLNKNEETMLQLFKNSKEARIKEGYTGNQICRGLVKEYGNLHRAFKGLGIKNTRINQILKGKLGVGKKSIESMSNLLGLDIEDYLDEYGNIQQEDE